MSTGANIRFYRRKAGMTQWQLSQAVKIRPGAMLLIERGQRECPKALLREIAKALGVSESELRG